MKEEPPNFAMTSEVPFTLQNPPCWSALPGASLNTLNPWKLSFTVSLEQCLGSVYTSVSAFVTRLYDLFASQISLSGFDH